MTQDARRMLTAQLTEVTRRLSREAGDDADRVSDEDRAAATVARELSVEERARLVAKAKALSAALDRFEDGTFGVCLGCGDPINPRRLAAVPEATHCVSCPRRAQRRARRGALMTACDRFVATFISTITNPWTRCRAADELEAVIQEARAEERRRLVTDRAAYETAVQRTARELAAEGAQLTSSERSA